jgi:hypothetical protein
MPWEIERHHVDLAEMMHETVFVERGVTTRAGEPARHILQIALGADGLSSTRGPGSSNLTLEDDGTLKDADGNVINPAAKQQEVLAKLNGLHKRGRAFAKKHGTKIFDGAGSR